MSMAPVTNEDPQGEPCVYEAGALRKTLVAVACVAVIAVAATGTNYASPGGNLSNLAATIVMAAVASVWLLRTLRRRLRLWPETFEYRGVFTTLSGRKDELAGYRYHHSRSGSSFEFRFEPPDARHFSIGGYSDQSGLRDWLRDVPDLNVVDREAYKKGLEANPAFGPDAARRVAALVRHRKITYGLNIAGIAVALWLVFFPRFFTEAAQVTALICMPGAMAIAALSGGRYAVTWDSGKPRLSLAGACFAPALGLGFYYYNDMGTLDGLMALPVAAAGAAMAMVVIVMIDRRMKLGAMGFAAACLVAGSWGGAMLIDHLADRAPAVVYASPIVRLRVSNTGRSTRYFVHVAPWGTPDMPDSLMVNPRFFYAAKVGQSMCMTTHPGAFGYRWFSYDGCREGGPVIASR